MACRFGSASQDNRVRSPRSSATYRPWADWHSLCSPRPMRKIPSWLLAAPAIINVASCTNGTTDPAVDAAPTRALSSTPAPGGVGVCCETSDFAGCSPGDRIRGVPSGGWAASEVECADHRGGGYDGCPFFWGTDEHGCRALRSEMSCSCPCGAPPAYPGCATRSGGKSQDASADDASDAGQGTRADAE